MYLKMTYNHFIAENVKICSKNVDTYMKNVCLPRIFKPGEILQIPLIWCRPRLNTIKCCHFKAI